MRKASSSSSSSSSSSGGAGAGPAAGAGADSGNDESSDDEEDRHTHNHGRGSGGAGKASLSRKESGSSSTGAAAGEVRPGNHGRGSNGLVIASHSHNRISSSSSSSAAGAGAGGEVNVQCTLPLSEHSSTRKRKFTDEEVMEQLKPYKKLRMPTIESIAENEGGVPTPEEKYRIVLETMSDTKSSREVAEETGVSQDNQRKYRQSLRRGKTIRSKRGRPPGNRVKVGGSAHVIGSNGEKGVRRR